MVPSLQCGCAQVFDRTLVVIKDLREQSSRRLTGMHSAARASLLLAVCPKPVLKKGREVPSGGTAQKSRLGQMYVRPFEYG